MLIENKELQDIAINFLNMVKSDLDEFTTRKSEIEPITYGAQMFSPSHVQFAKYGRGPGKPPPFKAILDWVQAKNIKFDGSTEEGTAYVIQQSIAKKGTLNFVRNAPNVFEESMDKYYDKYLAEVLDVFGFGTQQYIKAYGKFLPKTIYL